MGLLKRVHSIQNISTKALGPIS
jgi:hypothetical protein